MPGETAMQVHFDRTALENYLLYTGKELQTLTREEIRSFFVVQGLIVSKQWAKQVAPLSWPRYLRRTMSAETLIRLLLELDQTYESPRPSPWGEAAGLVQTLCVHADGSLRDHDLLGDYLSVDLSAIYKPVADVLHQPLLSALWENQRADRPL